MQSSERSSNSDDSETYELIFFAGSTHGMETTFPFDLPQWAPFGPALPWNVLLGNGIYQQTIIIGFYNVGLHVSGKIATDLRLPAYCSALMNANALLQQRFRASGNRGNA